MRPLRSLIVSCAAVLAAASMSPGDAAAQATPSQLEIVREGGTRVMLTPAALAAMPHVVVEGSDHGKKVTFSAVPLAALLKQAGVPLDSVRGPLVGMIVVATAADGYRATFSLGELAPDLGRTVAYVADQREGQALPAAEGPFRLVVPGDQRPARWVRQVVQIAVLRAAP